VSVQLHVVIRDTTEITFVTHSVRGWKISRGGKKNPDLSSNLAVSERKVLGVPAHSFTTQADNVVVTERN
jgi:hypothetical protein